MFHKDLHTAYVNYWTFRTTPFSPPPKYTLGHSSETVRFWQSWTISDIKIGCNFRNPFNSSKQKLNIIHRHFHICSSSWSWTYPFYTLMHFLHSSTVHDSISWAHSINNDFLMNIEKLLRFAASLYFFPSIWLISKYFIHIQVTKLITLWWWSWV